MLKCTVQKILKNTPRRHPFKDGYPRQKWWDGFKKRHPQIALRCGEGLKVKRAIGFTKENTTKFYNLLEQVYEAEEYPTSHIWNANEIWIQAEGSNSTLKVIAKRGSKAVRFTNVDNREWLSIMVCISATETYIPNVYIFRHEKNNILCQEV